MSKSNKLPKHCHNTMGKNESSKNQSSLKEATNILAANIGKILSFQWSDILLLKIILQELDVHKANALIFSANGIRKKHSQTETVLMTANSQINPTPYSIFLRHSSYRAASFF